MTTYGNVAAVARAYARQRAEQLLAENSFYVRELESIITDELRASVHLGITDYTTPLLATKGLRPDQHARLTKS